jgi:undecaprenyl diphosphate synthase
MWQTRNSQYYFTDKLFPDFDAEEFASAIKDYQKRSRRFGK